MTRVCGTRVAKNQCRPTNITDTINQSASNHHFKRRITMTLEDARRITAAAEKKSKEIGQPMNIAVADEGGNLVSHVRMDGAWMGSIDISIKKAWTARAFDISTKDL